MAIKTYREIERYIKRKANYRMKGIKLKDKNGIRKGSSL
jgi:hypothetical protein